MDINSINNLFSIITLGFGIYCIYAWYQLGSGSIPEKFVLLSRDLEPAKCLDQEYYISFMRPRLLVFSIAMVVFGGFSVLDGNLNLLAQWFPVNFWIIRLVVTSLVPLAIIVWFGVCLYKIQKELW